MFNDIDRLFFCLLETPTFKANDFIQTSKIVLNVQSSATINISVETTKIVRKLKH